MVTKTGLNAASAAYLCEQIGGSLNDLAPKACLRGVYLLL
jgi:hypothetical protein